MTTPDYPARIRSLRKTMGGFDAALVSLGSDLPYFTGYRAMETERLTMAVVPAAGDVTLVVPQLEAPRVVERPDVFTTIAWGDTDDPFAIVSSLLGPSSRGSLLLSDQTWSATMMSLQLVLSGATFQPLSAVSSRLRRTKDDQEIRALRAAATAVDQVAEDLADHRFSGKTERRLAREIAEMTVAAGTDEATFTIVASGPDSASPHHDPTNRIVVEGDTVVVDFGGTVDGYHSDTTRTFAVGPPAADASEVHAVVLEAQQAATAMAAPGVIAEDVDRAARSVIEAAGYGRHFIHRTGHGIGLDVHEDPYVVAGNREVLETGMAFSIEPGIYLPGRFGVRIEDIVVVTETEVTPLNGSNRDLVVVE